MNVILFHQGKNFPFHVRNCIKQLFKTNPDTKLHFITDAFIANDNLNIKIIHPNTLSVPNIGNYYKNDAFEDLWRTSLLRLFYIENYMEKNNITDVMHFDNDVLVYHNFNTIENNIKKFEFAITPSFETEYVFGFSFIKNHKSLSTINNKLLELVLQGEKELEKITNCMPHEMRLLNYINTNYNFKFIQNLPITPTGLGSDNFDLFKICFDPSTYGMHLGGSHCHGFHNENFVKTPQWSGTLKHHYIGRQLANNLIKIDFINKKPQIYYNNNEYTLMNLHIHSKELEKWM